MFRFWQLTSAFLVLACTLATNAQDYLDPELREEVDNLVRSVEETPTNSQNVRERAATLWRWTNAWALAGHFVPVNQTTVVSNILGYESQTRPAQHRNIEYYIRSFAFVDQDPGVLGKLRVEGGPFEAVSYDTLVQTSHRGYCRHRNRRWHPRGSPFHGGLSIPDSTTPQQQTTSRSLQAMKT